MAQTIAERRQRLAALIGQYGFRRQREVLGMWQQRVDELAERLRGRALGALAAAVARLAAARDRYGLRSWPRTLLQRREHVAQVARALEGRLANWIAGRRARLGGAADRLRALSPRQVMERGYCLVRADDGRLLRAAADVAVGDRITVEFARGEADARIETVRPEGAHGA